MLTGWDGMVYSTNLILVAGVIFLRQVLLVVESRNMILLKMSGWCLVC